MNKKDPDDKVPTTIKFIVGAGIIWGITMVEVKSAILFTTKKAKKVKHKVKKVFKCRNVNQS